VENNLAEINANIEKDLKREPRWGFFLMNRTNDLVSQTGKYVSQGGLTWMPINSSTKTWEVASAYCTYTPINGQTGWRLPTDEELSALYYASGPMKYQGWGWTLGSTWSSTPVDAGKAHNMIQLDNDGYVGPGVDAHPQNVTCVRETSKIADGVSTVVASNTPSPNGYISQGGLTWMPVSFKKTWPDAYAYCANTTINGQTGWRLPTDEELSALVNSGAMDDMTDAMEDMKVQGWTLNYTWLSSSDSAGRHHIGDPGSGKIFQDNDTYINYVTCVRGTSKIADGVSTVVVDNRAAPKVYISQRGLTWMPVSFKKTWPDAYAYCANTTINGQTGWRLPTKDELSALVNSGAMKGHSAFRGTWSSTPVSAGSHNFVSLGEGYVGTAIDTESVYVSCVR
jgi:hypothetical protein